MSRYELTADELRSSVNYDPATGVFTRLVGGRNTKVGDVAGSINPSNGYNYIRVMGTRFSAHRLAWLYVHGDWPSGEVDHINGVRHDNRILNLRDVDKSLNMRNQRYGHIGSASGYLGVRKSSHTKGKWLAEITAHKKRHHLGVFDTPEAAHMAYISAKRHLHGPQFDLHSTDIQTLMAAWPK